MEISQLFSRLSKVVDVALNQLIAAVGVKVDLLTAKVPGIHPRFALKEGAGSVLEVIVEPFSDEDEEFRIRRSDCLLQVTV